MTSDQTPLDQSTSVSIGRIAAAHGIYGEIKVDPLTDFPQRFDQGSQVWLAGQPRRVQRSRWQGKLVILKLAGINDRTTAESLKGQELQAPEAMPIEDEDVYYRHDIIGLDVVDQSGETLGKVEDVFSTGANDVYVVRGPRGELLLPAIEDVIKQVDLATGRIFVDLIPGLDFLVYKPKAPRRNATQP